MLETVFGNVNLIIIHVKDSLPSGHAGLLLHSKTFPPEWAESEDERTRLRANLEALDEYTCLFRCRHFSRYMLAREIERLLPFAYDLATIVRMHCTLAKLKDSITWVETKSDTSELLDQPQNYGNTPI